jgi:two-component system sensor histidine kinase KdpD
VTVALVFGVTQLTGIGSVSLLFLFPVIASAARAGFGPATTAALLSALAHNVLFVVPDHIPDPLAPQSWLMAAALGTVGGYTALQTRRLRSRVLLSDRSAQENAAIAGLAADLTRAASWQETGEVVCARVHSLLNVQTMVLRRAEGEFVRVAACPDQPPLSPVDAMALDWAWTRGEPAGSGAEAVTAANWQFLPLATSLGPLAVLGIAREDGRAPVRPDQQVLLSTLVAQIALAHERLELEERFRAEESKLSFTHRRPE